MYHMHTPGSELEQMPYWEFEMMVETLQDVLKKKQDAEKKSYKDSDAYSMNPSAQANSMMKTASSSMPKAPSMPSPSSFRMPKM